MSIIYNFLKMKAEKNPNDILYIEGNDNKKCTFDDFYKQVNENIKRIEKNNNMLPVYLVIDTTIEAIALFIALVYLELKPIIISYKQIENSHYSNEEESSEYQVYSSKIINLRKVYSFIQECVDINNSTVIDYSDKKNENYFYIQTSGTTTGKPKLVKKYESDLQNDVCFFSSSQHEIYYTSSDISKLSGLWQQVFIPICLENYNTIVISGNENDDDLVSYLAKYNITRMFKPKNFERDIYSGCQHKLNRIYVAGEVVNKHIVNKLIKDFNVDFANVVNVYGQTEFGLISTCNGIIPDSFNISAFYGKDDDLFPDNLVRMIGNFSNVSKEYLAQLRMKYTGNNQLTMYIQNNHILFEFVTLYPVSKDRVNNIKLVDIDYVQNKESFWLNCHRLGNNFLKEIYYKNISTGDVGFYYDNKLYVCGRKSEIINNCITLPIIESTLQENFQNTHALYCKEINNVFFISGVNLVYGVSKVGFFDDNDLQFSSFYWLNIRKRKEANNNFIRSFDISRIFIPDYQIIKTIGLGKYERVANYQYFINRIKEIEHNYVNYDSIIEEKLNFELSAAKQVNRNYFCIDKDAVDEIALLEYLKSTVSSPPSLVDGKYYFYINDYFMFGMTREDLMKHYPSYAKNDEIFDSMIEKKKVKKMNL